MEEENATKSNLTIWFEVYIQSNKITMKQSNPPWQKIKQDMGNQFADIKRKSFTSYGENKIGSASYSKPVHVLPGCKFCSGTRGWKSVNFSLSKLGSIFARCRSWLSTSSLCCPQGALRFWFNNNILNQVKISMWTGNFNMHVQFKKPFIHCAKKNYHQHFSCLLINANRNRTISSNVPHNTENRTS